MAPTGAAGAAQNLSGGSSVTVTLGGAATGAAAGSGTTQAEPDPELPYFESNRILEVQIELDESHWNALRSEERTWRDVVLGSDCLSSPFDSPYTWKPATVTVDGTTRSNVGLRKKGFLGSLDRERPSLKIAFDQFQTQDLFGVRDLTLNNAAQDPAVMSQCLAYAVFAKAGVSAPRCNFAHLTVNGQNLGVYAHVEPIKKPFLRRQFGSDTGDLYEGTISDFREGWLGTFDPKTSNTSTAKETLAAVTRATNSPSSRLQEELAVVVELDEFAVFWAVEVLIAHLDGYSRNVNNFYVYRPPSTGRYAFLPWGVDMVFGTNDATAKTDAPISKYTQGVVAHALYSTTDGRSLLLSALQSVLEKVWNESELVLETQRMAQLIRPRLGPKQLESFESGLQALRDFIASRRTALLKAIVNPPAPQTLRPYACMQSIGTVSGTFSTTWQVTPPANPFTVGTAALDVLLNGSPWTSVPGQIGAYASLNPDQTAEQDAQLVIPAVLTNGKVGVVAFGLDPADAAPGTMALKLDDAAGMLVELDPADSSWTRILGIAAGGSLVFEAAGTSPGDPVVGHFSAEVYYTPFLNGF